MIEVRNAHKELGEFSLRGVDMRVETGEYFVVLGPTGAGKTVLLECITGLYKLDQGEVWLDGQEVTRLLPEERNIGYVPQDYVLFPHITLRENVEFSLSVRGSPRDFIDQRVQALANLLGIAHLLDRRPRTLSGGEQQRGALARALAPSPTVLLLDEPLSALDEGTRTELAEELSKVSRDMGTTVIHVCHNFDEALELADRIGIIRQGRLIQIGTPADVFRKPSSEFVARFVGAKNVFRVAAVQADTSTVTVEGNVTLHVGHVPEGEALLATIRPEEIAVVPAAGEAARARADTNVLRLRLVRVEDRGRIMRLHLSGQVELCVAMTRQAFAAAGVSPQTEVEAQFDRHSVHVLRA
jgi:ABC-type Fe3+/spermidine/putrescine transport system ATPase subunit